MARLRRRHILRAVVLFLLISVVLFLRTPRSLQDGLTRLRPHKDILDNVNLFIGTVNGGHAFPGASLPYSMAKAGPDCTGEAYGGFASDGSPISGFSHMHDSGTGGTLSLGNFPLFPQYCPYNDPERCKFTKSQRRVDRGVGADGKELVDARPGYFEIELADGISGEATVTKHTALYRFTFPMNTTYYDGGGRLNPVIVLDLVDLPDTRSRASITVDPDLGRMFGNGTFRPSFGTGAYELHFCADFRVESSGGGLKRAAVWADHEAKNSTAREKEFEPGARGGGVMSFLPSEREQTVLARVGLSFISASQACGNAEAEIGDWGFERVRAEAESAWRKRLDVVDVVFVPGQEDLVTVFYSGIYRSILSPQDYSGENPLWNSSEPYFDSFYCIWDSFRAQHPFLTLVDPKEQTRMVRALIDIYKHEGKLPDCRMSLCKGFTQGGSNADIVLADALIKNLSEGVDWNLAYEAVLSDAEIEPENWQFEGRGGLDSWKELGYIPFQDESGLQNHGLRTRSVSRTVEYAYDDFAIAQMALLLHKPSPDYQTYLNRSANWENLFKSDQSSFIRGNDTGFRGFLQPRYADGDWKLQDPAHCSPLLKPDSCYLDGAGGESYEGSLWLYTLISAPHDMASLISLLGGNEEFVRRLDFLHESGLLYIGDEQAFLTVWLYHYAGRPGLSGLRVRDYVPRLFNTSTNGIPGNDDSGAMGSFVSFCLMGVFPNPGQDVYLLGVPFFPEVRIRNDITGNVATIRVRHFNKVDWEKRVFVQMAYRDGREWRRSWIGHDFFAGGGVLEFVVGERESEWGTREEDLPPSLSDGKNQAGG